MLRQNTNALGIIFPNSYDTVSYTHQMCIRDSRCRAVSVQPDGHLIHAAPPLHILVALSLIHI